MKENEWIEVDIVPKIRDWRKKEDAIATSDILRIPDHVFVRRRALDVIEG